MRTQIDAAGLARPAHTVLRSLLAITAACALGASGVALGANGPAAHPTVTPVLSAKARPQAVRSDDQVKVVVRLQADSVAEARARTATLSLTAEEERAVVNAAHLQHVAIRPALEGMGARVVSEMHHAINGIAVVVPRKQVASLASLPGVRSVNMARTYQRNNAVGVPYIGAPLVWQGNPSFKGDGVNVAIIDTGIDYTHADFGGPGTVAAFNAAAATSTLPADPTLFGPNAPKVKGGTDLAGDAYNADDPTSVPAPDPNPLDCNGHGSHVAGTLAGFGVANGATYTGPYNQSIYGTTTFDIGPGVAPHANIYSVRVFGCTGTTNLVTEAIDWAVANHMDVISMSLGSASGRTEDADAIAVENATRAGIISVIAAGNNGPAPYLSSDPATADHAISAAAMDARSVLPDGVVISFSNGTKDNAVEADTTLKLPGGTVPVVVLASGSGLALGCSASDYPSGGTPGALVIVSRGSCTFVQKATLATQAGAVAIGVVNNSAGYFNPSIPGVTIPFLEMLQSDTPTLLAAAGTTGSLVAGPIPNLSFETIASFSSGGPRSGDSVFKPNVSAPGVGVISVLSGSGTGSANDSGTSMATPHVAGVAALVRQAHPNWAPHSVAAAIVESANPGKLVTYDPRLDGAGVVQVPGAVATQVVAFGDRGRPSVSFGFDESTRGLHETQTLRLRNHGRQRARFSVSYSPAQTASNVPHTLHVRDAVTVDGNDETELTVTLDVPAATVGGTHDANGNDVYRDAAGVITLTPVGASNNGVTLTVPYYLVPRVRSDVDASLQGSLSQHHPAANLRLTNRGAALAGTADFYSWGLYSASQGDPDTNTRAVGVQTNLFPDNSDSVLVFAINTWERQSNFAPGNEWDVLIDTNGDGQPDFVLFAADEGSVLSSSANGVLSVFLYDLSAQQIVAQFGGEAPTDGTVLELPVYASMLGLSATNPTFAYQVQWFTRNGGAFAMPGQGTFNAWAPSISASGALFQVIPSGGSVTVPVSITPSAWAQAPSLGLMLISEDNASKDEALLFKAR